MRNTARRPRKPDHPHRFSQQSDLLQLLGDGKDCRMVRRSSFPSFSAQTQGDCDGRVRDNVIRIMCVPSGWISIWRSMYEVQSRFTVCDFDLALSPDGDQRWPAMPCWPPRGGSVWSSVRYLPHLAYGALSSALCGRPSQYGDGAHPGGLPLPTYVLADEKPSHCLTTKCTSHDCRGRVIWHLAIPRTLVRRLYPVYQDFNAPHPSKSHHIGSGAF